MELWDRAVRARKPVQLELIRNGEVSIRKFSREEISWMFYDWANSVFSIVMTTALLPIYFKAAAAGAGISGPNSTAIWGYVNSFSTLIVAVLRHLIFLLLLIIF